MTNPEERLKAYLSKDIGQTDYFPLTPDASTREYFRIVTNNATAIACVYPEAFIASEHSYIDVTSLFLSSSLPVAKILDTDEKLGIIILEDFGDDLLRDSLQDSTSEKKALLLNNAIGLIPRIQSLTKKAFDTNSIASRLKFDVEKLTWELDFFKTHYFETLRGVKLNDVLGSQLDREFLELSKELDSLASVLCHRDFHSANLMIGNDGELKIIDHQDARIGTSSYDLVSLLLDRVTEIPDSVWISDKIQYFLNERNRLGLREIDIDTFNYEFRLQTIQRCLKAAGTFSYQSVNRGKTHFIEYIKPMFRIVINAIDGIGKYPTISEVLIKELENEI